MKILEYKNLSIQKINSLVQRKNLDLKKAFKVVQEIEQKILKNGDKALSFFTEKFDKVKLKNFQVSQKELIEADNLISVKLKRAIKNAFLNIKKFHQHQLLKEKKIEIKKGITCWREIRPIEKVGLYVPSGVAPLFSTVLMLAIPAKIAGCKEIILCTPSQQNGQVFPAILWAAQLCGVNKIYKLGGAQAIFALSHGTKQVDKVDKIFGPGNQFTTAAKIMVSQKVAIDIPAGPSEVLIIADDDANSDFIAADLLSQAEHGKDSSCILLCTNQKKALEVLNKIKQQLKNLPRQNFIKKSLANSFILLCSSLQECFDFSNLYAPEHLILQIKDWKKYQQKIKHAGSVFCGYYSPESAGDYASGTNHVLPTSSFVRSFSGVSVDNFVKKITWQNLSKKGLESLSKTICTMAENEGLIAHKKAVEIRL